MKITETSNVPDSTYFLTGDCEPDINDDGSITVYDGEGSRRSWGAPRVWSNVIVNECDLVAIHVGFSHKHGGSQFWRYYTTDGNKTSQIRWSAIPDATRQRILDAYKEKAPHWAKGPGKLRANYKKPSSRKMTTYKIVERNGEALISLYDGTQYEIGKRLAEAVNGEVTQWGDAIHDGGFYSHPSVEQVKSLYASGNLVPARCLDDNKTLVIVECEISGKIVKYPNGKLCSTYIVPQRIVEEFEHTA